MSSVRTDFDQPQPTILRWITDGHAATKEFLRRVERHEVSRAQLPRALAIIDALAAAAQARSWTVETSPDSEDGFGLPEWSSLKDGHLRIANAEVTVWVRIQEEGVLTRGSERADASGPAYDAAATGRLKLELRWGPWYTRQQRRWADRSAAALQERIPEMIAEIESRIQDASEDQAARQSHAEHEEHEHHSEHELRETRREDLIADARRQHSDQARAEELISQATRWQQASLLRDYCEAMEQAYGENPQTQEWIAWTRDQIARIDPLSAPPCAPPEKLASADELDRHMPPGWSVRNPD